MNDTQPDGNARTTATPQSPKPSAPPPLRSTTKAAKTVGSALFKIVWGTLGFLAGFLILSFLSLMIIGPIAVVPIVIFLVVAINGGKREARGEKLGWAYFTCIILFTGIIPGFIGLGGVSLFLRGKAYFSQG